MSVAATEPDTLGIAAGVDIEKNCQQMAQTRPENTHEIASKMIEMAHAYYKDACVRAQQSFRVALSAAGIGIFLIFAGGVLVMSNTTASQQLAKLTTVAGLITETISAIVFVLYFKTVRHFVYFHVCLERTNRFLLANSVCTNIDCVTTRDQARLELMRIMGNAPMLPILDAKEDRQPKAKSKSASPSKAAAAAAK